jgi:hypothetical protein
MDQVLEQLQQLPEALQREALDYLEGFVSRHRAAGAAMAPVKKRQAGMMQGTFVLPLADDFDAPLADFQEYME